MSPAELKKRAGPKVVRVDSKIQFQDMGSSSSSSSSEERSLSDCAKTMTMKTVAHRVAKGETLVIYENKVYNITLFLQYHPGGELVVKHMAGCDATDEINGLHPRWVIDEKMPRYFIANLVPDDSTSTSSEAEAAEEEVLLVKQRTRTAYRKLEQKIKDAGLFETNHWYYFAHLVQYTTFITISVLGVIYGTQWWHFAISAVFMGAFWQQSAFTAHDAGHNGITHVREIDEKIGIFLGNFCGGLSIGWWKKSHYVHHIVTNHPEHDPDIQQLPFFALSKRFLTNVYSSYYNKTLVFDDVAKAVIPFQHLYYYVILGFGRFLLYFLGWSFVLTEPGYKKRNAEITGFVFYFIWLSTLVSMLPSWKMRVMWVLISHISTVFLHIQINLSHYSMSMEDLGKDEPFPAKMLRTTMDVDCPWWMDWFHGGLQFQAIHHLFPRVPRHNLRSCVPFVREFAEEAGIEYKSYKFVEANGQVWQVMREIGEQVSLLAKVAHAEASGHHFH
ncbi:delta-6 fatty acid desaturase [Powellomyces hirtus]|nr:delta-6 fatty acid desaturase [Powellomyces hirtus]